MQIEADSSVLIQGKQTHQVTVYCVDTGTGEKRDVSVELIRAINQLQTAAGFISGLVIFGLSMLFRNGAARRLGKSFYEWFQAGTRRV